MGSLIFFFSLTVLFLGYFMYIPLPAGVEDPWKLRFTTLFIDTGVSIAYIVEKITGTPFAETFHKISVILARPVHESYPEIQVENRNLDGIPVRVYKPKALPDGLNPCVVYIHGGGWVTLSIDNYDPLLVKVALETNAIVVAVRYRYAPKHPYPVPFDDCVKAMAYLLRSGETLGVDVNKVAVMGDSAGGNMAAAVSLRLSQEDPAVMPPIKLQVLICPMLQALTFNTTSMREYANWFLKRELTAFFWAAYLGLELKSETYRILLQDAHVSTSVQRSIYGSYVRKIRGKINEKYDPEMARRLDHLVIEPFVSPLMADDLSKVAPAYVIAMEFDVVRDEAILYAERLKQANVKTDLWLVKGQPHMGLIFIESTEKIFSNITEYIKKVF